MQSSNPESWAKVKSKKSQNYKSKIAALTKEAKQKPSQSSAEIRKKELLAKNHFFVPSKPADETPKSAVLGKISLEQQRKKSLKTFLKNQRRNARRRATRKRIDGEVDVSQSDVSLGDETVQDTASSLFALPPVLLTDSILTYLEPQDLAALSTCSNLSKVTAENGRLWKKMYQKRFPESNLVPKASSEWKRAYQLSETKLVDRLRCFSTRKTFLEDVIGVGANYTVNPKTKNVDYVELSQDLLSESAFQKDRVRKDAFGNTFKLFLPLYFTKEHFSRGLPAIEKTIFRLCSPSDRDGYRQFHTSMVLDVLPKLINTFTVLLSDEGISACHKSYDGLLQIHRLFLALAQKYPSLENEAVTRLRKFASNETYRTKSSCANLGLVIPLLLIVEGKDVEWAKVFGHFMSESFDRSVLWCCKKYPELERTISDDNQKVESAEKADRRVALTLDAMQVNLRLMMLHAYFHRTLCRDLSVQQRATQYDGCFGRPHTNDEEKQVPDAAIGGGSPTHDADPLSFAHFRNQVNLILSLNSWKGVFGFLRIKCPASKAEMARQLRQHVSNSRRKKYHRTGMDYARVQASGVSKILSKGQQYSTDENLRRVVFRDDWTYTGGTKYLDATCLVYKGSELFATVDYTNTTSRGIRHSGDVMRANGGTHTIEIDLQALDPAVTSCYFVISAWANATLFDILSPSISFSNAEDDTELCRYDLDAHDKVSYLTSVVMCRLYRTGAGVTWHVQAIGEAHKGAAGNYGPIHSAVKKLVLK